MPFEIDWIDQSKAKVKNGKGKIRQEQPQQQQKHYKAKEKQKGQFKLGSVVRRRKSQKFVAFNFIRVYVDFTVKPGRL